MSTIEDQATAYASKAVAALQEPLDEAGVLAAAETPLPGDPFYPIPEALRGTALDPALRLAAEALPALQDPAQASRLAFLCGIWIENGGDPSLVSEAIVERCAANWVLVRQAAERLDIDQVEDVGPAPFAFAEDPDAARAWWLAKYLHLAAMAALCRDRAARIRARTRPALLSDLRRIWHLLPNGYYLKEVLQGVDRLPVVVLHPFEGVGCRLSADAVRNTWHLLSLVQGLMAEPGAPLSGIPGCTPDPDLLAYARAQTWNRETNWDDACFGFYNASAWQGDGFSPDADATAAICGHGSPVFIPRVDGHAVILLSAVRHGERYWSANWITGLHEALKPTLDVHDWLDADGVAGWLGKIADSRPV